MLDFFELVLPDEDGWVPIIHRDDLGNLRNTSWFIWPLESHEMIEHIESISDEDVYFSPMLFSEPKTRRTAGHVAKANVTSAVCVYADGDTADPSVYQLPPTVNVQTSEGRWHNYWRITDTSDPETIEQLSHSISKAHKDDGVDNGWALSKRLRVPGTTNTKSGVAYNVRSQVGGEVYTLEGFSAAYQPVTSSELQNVDFPDEVPTAWDVLNIVEGDPELLHLFQVPPIRDYSHALFRLELKLFEYGLDAVQVFAVAREAACNKFDRPGRKEEELWRHVLTAQSKYEEEYAEPEPDDEEPEPEPEPERIHNPREVYEETSWEDLELLTEEERESLPRTFIDRFADWGNSQSALSARQYHEGAAFMLLSTVFSEFGYVHPSYGKVFLNLYMLVLGETTRSRKSTSLRFMLRILDELSNGTGYEYLPAQDATPEALTEYLAERPGRSSLFWRDEVQGMFQDVKSGGYLRGMFTMLTAAYDGYVNGVLRRTGGNKRTKRTQTNLSFYGVGITEQTMKSLTEDDFKSGFIPRFLWIIDQGAKYSIGTEDVSQYHPDKDVEQDRVFDRMVADLSTTRTFWERYKNRSGEPSLITYSAEAWQRWQQFTVDIEEQALAHTTHSALLDAPAQRLGVTVLKMSALLSMFHKQQEVQLEHMLTAIHYANKFVKYTEYAARQVSQSAQERDLEELEEMVLTSAKPVTYATALKKFRDRKTLREFDEMVKWLIEEGSIAISISGKNKVLEAR